MAVSHWPGMSPSLLPNLLLLRNHPHLLGVLPQSSLPPSTAASNNGRLRISLWGHNQSLNHRLLQLLPAIGSRSSATIIRSLLPFLPSHLLLG